MKAAHNNLKITRVQNLLKRRIGLPLTKINFFLPSNISAHQIIVNRINLHKTPTRWSCQWRYLLYALTSSSIKTPTMLPHQSHDYSFIPISTSKQAENSHKVSSIQSNSGCQETITTTHEPYAIIVSTHAPTLSKRWVEMLRIYFFTGTTQSNDSKKPRCRDLLRFTESLMRSSDSCSGDQSGIKLSSGVEVNA